LRYGACRLQPLIVDLHIRAPQFDHRAFRGRLHLSLDEIAAAEIAPPDVPNIPVVNAEIAIRGLPCPGGATGGGRAQRVGRPQQVLEFAPELALVARRPHEHLHDAREIARLTPGDGVVRR
jgi:hypothetical protein